MRLPAEEMISTITPSTQTVETIDRLHHIARVYAPAVLASSFSAEDMILLDIIARHDLEIDIVTIDTGRLPEETHRLVSRAREHYGLPIAVLMPLGSDVEAYVAAHGPNAFYDDTLLRQECCHLRKVRPLRRALAGKRAWITGQRREQSLTRQHLPLAEWDAANKLRKFNPLAKWSSEEIWSYIRANQVPYSELYDRGYTSIGCAPCTRAIAPGEELRSGRWWWEGAEHRECGLHVQKQAT
jgi:phosphoadenosine phosphosulfate reductase